MDDGSPPPVAVGETGLDFHYDFAAPARQEEVFRFQLQLACDADKPVIIHCKSGGRSGVIVMELERRFGMTNLYNLKGGILAYSRNIDPSIPIY